jgi:hypothetical protein
VPEWLVVKFKEGDGDYGEYEVSVVHKSDTHGQISWGWSSPTKIIIDNGNENYRQAVKIAKVLCKALNAA